MVLKGEKKMMGGINASRQQFISVNKEVRMPAMQRASLLWKGGGMGGGGGGYMPCMAYI
jgi:hypothetical protein